MSKEFAPNLEELSLVRAWSDFNLSGLNNLPCLKSLDLHGNVYFPDISTPLPNLEFLGLRCNNDLRHLSLSAFAPNLKSLHIWGPYIFSKTTAPHWKFDSLPYLEKLTLSSCHWFNLGFLPSLKELVLGPSVIQVVNFNNLPRLEKLDVFVDSTYNKFNLHDVADLQYLQSLRFFVGVRRPWFEILKQMDEVILPGLEELYIAGLEEHRRVERIDETDLRGAPIASFAPNLKKFSLINATHISDSAIAQLANLRNLQDLHLGGPDLDHDIIEKLENLRILEGLCLEFTDMRLTQFDRLPKSLTSLSLDQSRLSPESFESLLSLKQLKRLVITDIDGPITPAMVDALQNALPNCEIVR